MIICGFPGTGKTIAAKFGKWVDLESTPFECDWMRYAKVAKHMSDNGYTVMVSTHEELMDCFELMEVPYTVIIPNQADMNIYIERYRQRGNNESYIRKVEDNWDSWIGRILAHWSVLRTVVMLPKDGCIKAFVDSFGKESR